MAAYDGCAQNNSALLVGKHARKPTGVAVNHGAVIVSKGQRECLKVDTFLPRLSLVGANMRNLRIGVGTPGDHQITGPFVTEEQGILQCDAAESLSSVCELVT